MRVRADDTIRADELLVEYSFDHGLGHDSGADEGEFSVLKHEDLGRIVNCELAIVNCQWRRRIRDFRSGWKTT